MIASSWLLAWDAYVKGGPRPGPVSNHLLFEDDGKSLKTGMKSRIDYKGLYFHEFDGLIKLFGGGPVIARSTTDIYSDLPNNPNPPVGSEQDGKMVNTQNGEPDD